MSRKNETVRTSDLSRRLGERGDFVACKTTEIGAAARSGTVTKDDVDELREALDELDALLEQVDVGSGAGRSAASAD